MTITQYDEILKMALVGYEERLKELHRQISDINIQTAEIKRKLTMPIPGTTAQSIRAVPKRHVSASGKAAIAKAQRARWAAYNKAKAKKAQKAA